MILKSVLDVDDRTITVEIEDDDDIPEYEDIISIEGEGIMLGNLLYDKYGIRTYEILERDLDDPWEDDEN